MRTRAIALISSLFIAAGISLSAQSGANHVTGQDEAGYESLSSKVLKLEKKSDAFNFYLNFAAAAGLSDSEGKWQGSMYSKHLRMEILGDLTPRIYYRFRHHLDMAALKASLDNFALATDMMYVGYRASGKLDAIAGKMPTAVGGFEFDEMPVYIYRFFGFHRQTGLLPGRCATFLQTGSRPRVHLPDSQYCEQEIRRPVGQPVLCRDYKS